MAVANIRYLPTTELILWMTKERVQPNFERSASTKHIFEVWRIPPSHTPEHPATFPIELPSNILSCVKRKENVVVYDPYSGLGTTLQAAKIHGFDYIGSEISPTYKSICEEKLYGIEKENEKNSLF